VLGAVLAQYGLGLASARLTWLSGYELVSNLRLRVLDHIRRLPMGFLSRRQTGDVATVLTQDLRMVEPVVAEILPSLVGALVVPFALTVATLVLDWRMGAATLVTLLVAIPVHVLTERRFVALAVDRQQRQAEAVARILEYVQGIAVIRAFNQSGERLGRFRTALDEYRATNLRLVHKLTPLLNTVFATIELGFAVVLAMAVFLFIGGSLSSTTALVFLVLALRIYQPIVQIVDQSELQNISRASIGRVLAVLEVPPQPQPARHVAPSSWAVSFEGVRFSYDQGTRDESLVLGGVDFVVEERSLTALVGPSGAGKSTIAHLLARFWDVQAGHIRIGGVDLRDLPESELFRAVSIVFQDPYLFNDTIAANLRLGNPDATSEEVVAAARAAQCHDFITELPQGYDTSIGEGGATLSGGQRQRISIARAILKDAPIVVLDEPTASIDPTNERLLQEALSALVASRTVLVVAHRLASIRHADQILVLDGGVIRERGRHDELVAQGGRYAHLWDAQRRARGWRLG
jgi:ATP-binding cassette, subfamily B, bacterial IrtB/YbtQ